jgi:hypothetical protein
MKWLEYLDRRHERKMALRAVRPFRPLDSKLLAAVMFFAGYYVLVFILAQRSTPAANVALVRDSLLVLGPAIGVIVGATWRTDQRDEQQARNTGEGFRALGEQAKATRVAAEAAAGGLNADERPAGTVGDPVHVEGKG